MRGNKGEWSELYTLFKLLADGRLYAADKNTNKLNDIFYDVVKIVRNQTNGNFEYARNGNVNIIDADTNEVILCIPAAEFNEKAELLFAEMKHPRNKGAFEAPLVWRFAKSIKCETIKAKSTDKSDITIVVHDFNTGITPTLGFSIKSQLGSASTLLNASAATNFKYRIIGKGLSKEELKTFNSLTYFKDKFLFLENKGISLEFIKINSEIFQFNFMLVDTLMSEIMAKLLLYFYMGMGSRVSDLLCLISNEDPFKLGIENANTFYSYKVKELLTNIALGMVPSSFWDGKFDATGGYIIVKDDGDVLCYHIYNRNEFRDYLFENTKFDTPSTSRHGFGKIYEESGDYFIKLNLQIRFIK